MLAMAPASPTFARREPLADVEGYSLSPAGEARRREEGVEGGGEVLALFLLEEDRDGQRVDLGDGRVEDVLHEGA